MPFSPEADKVAKQRKGGKGEKAPPEIDRNIVFSENVSKIKFKNWKKLLADIVFKIHVFVALTTCLTGAT